MARLRAFVPIDMHDYASSLGVATYADSTTVVVSNGYSDTYWLGRFSYPGQAWTGTITAAEVYHGGSLQLSVHGLSIPTAYAQVGVSRYEAYSNALSGHDRIAGSRGGDRLDGFDGNDVVNGRGGRDRLFGGEGHDRIIGGGGRDALTGGEGADAFVFGARTGRDRVRDFESGEDRLVIRRGAEDMGDLAITDKGHATKVSFARTTILLEGVDPGELDATDFVFL